ncbi:very short patch repair endonuclease [Jatrophihabitans sp. YIM 134969]
MARQRHTGTGPEMLLRRELHRRGLRYRVHSPLPVLGLGRRRADLLFTRRRVAVFVDGCFWHACPVHGTAPKANKEWWAIKLRSNVQRDRDTDERLVNAGWTVLRFWEHEDAVGAADVIEQAVRPAS